MIDNFLKPHAHDFRLSPFEIQITVDNLLADEAVEVNLCRITKRGLIIQYDA